LLPNY